MTIVNMKEISPQQEIIRQLAENAYCEKVSAGSNGVQAKPGEMIQSLGPVKRRILQNLKVRDIENDRWPR